MDNTIETKPVRTYCFRMTAGDVVRIQADVMCEGNSGKTLKREGQVVGRITASTTAWWIEEERPGGPGFAD